MSCVCKICGKEFLERGLHGHISRSHNLSAPEYYEKYLPRHDKLSGEKIPFIDYDLYFSAQFVSKENERTWLKTANKEDAKEYLLSSLKRRIADKELKYAPSFVEFETSNLPPYKAFVYFFGSYEAACKEVGVEPLLVDKKAVPNLSPKDVEVLIDTREQLPLEFPNSKIQKLAFGDYTLSGDDYNYTYVDRKSDSDFKGTVTAGQERFMRELDRCGNLDSYLYIVVEDSIDGIIFRNKASAHPSNMNYVWAAMRKIQHAYPHKCQFVFTGSRVRSQKIIPYLLRYGKELWNTDIQYLLSLKE